MSVIKKTTGQGFLYARTINVAQAEVSRRARHVGWILIPRATIINLEAFLDTLEMRRDFFEDQQSLPSGFLSAIVLGDVSQPPQPPHRGLHSTSQ